MSALNLAEGWFLDEGGSLWPITNLIDADGEECDEVEDAVWCVAGHGDHWYSIRIGSFEPLRTN